MPSMLLGFGLWLRLSTPSISYIEASTMEHALYYMWVNQDTTLTEMNVACRRSLQLLTL